MAQSRTQESNHGMSVRAPMIRCDWLSDEFQREYDRSMVYDLSDPLPELPSCRDRLKCAPMLMWLRSGS